MFTLTSGSNDFQFILNGDVNLAGHRVGSWEVNSAAKIAITDGDHQGTTFDVLWGFNTDNQLQILADPARTEIFNFHSLQDAPDISLDEKNFITVRPLIDSGFEIKLAAEFSLDADYNLGVKIGTESSKIEGSVSDSLSRFIYTFVDAQDPIGIPYELQLTGEWRKDPKADGELLLQFVYKVGAAPTELVVDFPAGFKVDPKRNHLTLQYKKAGRGYGIVLRSQLEINDNTNLVFNIAKQQTTEGSVIEISGALVIEHLDNAEPTKISFHLRKADGTNGQQLQLGGRVQASLGQNGVDLTFAYNKNSGGLGTEATASMAIGLTIKSQSGSDVSLAFKRNGQDSEFTLALSKLSLGKVEPILLDGGLKVTDNGQEKGVVGFLGISWA